MITDINEMISWVERHPKFVHYLIFDHNHRGKPRVLSKSLTGEEYDSAAIAEIVQQELGQQNGKFSVVLRKSISAGDKNQQIEKFIQIGDMSLANPASTVSRASAPAAGAGYLQLIVAMQKDNAAALLAMQQQNSALQLQLLETKFSAKVESLEDQLSAPPASKFDRAFEMACEHGIPHLMPKLMGVNPEQLQGAAATGGGDIGKFQQDIAEMMEGGVDVMGLAAKINALHKSNPEMLANAQSMIDAALAEPDIKDK